MSDYLRVDRTQLLSMPFASYATFQAINQPPILVPGQRDRIRKSILNLKKPPNAYYGIGGSTETFRTFISLFGLERYKSEVQRSTGIYPGAILYDAFCYDLLNQIDGYEQPKDVWKAFRELLDGKSAEIKVKSSRRRDVYQRMAGLVDSKIRYVDASLLLRQPEYEEILSELLSTPSLSTWELLVPVSYRNKVSSLLYVPMEIAEALTLKQKFGIGLKIGDRKEKGFDDLIYREDSNWIFAYTPPAITPNGERAPYRANDINFDMTIEEARSFLERSPEGVKQQFAWLLQELGRSSGNLVEDTIAVFSAVKGDGNA